MQNNLPLMLHIGAVAPNHAIKANIPNFRRHLSLANGKYSRLRYMTIIIDDGTVHIQKDDFSRHKTSSSSHLPITFFLIIQSGNFFLHFYKFSHFWPVLLYELFILLYIFLKAFSYRIIRDNGTILFSEKKSKKDSF